jgi:hypothetical protein
MSAISNFTLIDSVGNSESPCRSCALLKSKLSISSKDYYLVGFLSFMVADYVQCSLSGSTLLLLSSFLVVEF